LKRRGGVPSGAAQVIAGTGLPFPEITGIVLFSWEILFSGDSPSLIGYLVGEVCAVYHPPGERKVRATISVRQDKNK